ncbi:MAG: response regulator transcription factor [Flavisolibacter sp.]|nr:response regulator transcription factor [Flavisolibacter sp.]
MGREKILVVDSDLDSLSKIYLALIHRRFKVEACNNPEEFYDRMKRFKPAVVILNLDEYRIRSEKLKQPAIVLVDNEKHEVQLNDGDILLTKPVPVDELLKAVERLI